MNAERPDLDSLAQELLEQMKNGDPAAAEKLLECLYVDLRRMAGAMMQKERPGHTLQATALVHEAYVRLFAGKPPSANNRQHFLALTGKVMGRLLVDHSRRKQADKRFGGKIDSDAEIDLIGVTAPTERLLEMDAALETLEKLSARAARIIEWKYFVGMTHAEIAQMLGVTERTVQRDVNMAEAFLRSVLPRRGHAGFSGRGNPVQGAD
jgi:RNA polymerase sigma factor (TIGR02999 family)